MTSSITSQKRPHASSRARIQVNASPYQSAVDFSPLDELEHGNASLDLVSIADLLRNSFVYPPHSIYRNVKVAFSGFDPSKDLHDHPSFHFPFGSTRTKLHAPSNDAYSASLTQTYHRLLCDAVKRSLSDMRAPWLLQSGGKDSTSMAIAIAETRPDTTCLTYLGGTEENEVESARSIAKKLGLRHEVLMCDPGRAYDRYLAMLPRMPLLTADFATLSYADLATEVQQHGGDGMVDALGSDHYFGSPLHSKDHMLAMLSRSLRLPSSVFHLPLIKNNFKLCFALATLQMNKFERYFPGSRFSDAEVDALYGWNISAKSRQRMETFRAEIAAADSADVERIIAFTILESPAMGKGMYVAKAMSLRVVYPYCNAPLRDWILHQVPDDQVVGAGGVNKVLIRRHIAEHFNELPYVRTKGSFRFDLRGLARQRFNQVYAFAQQTRAILPGVPRWLETHRHRLDNKYFASKFYLLAVTLPWLLSRMPLHTPNRGREVSTETTLTS
ncbi:asparagine synthase-related protein [Dyella nitratireducens]|uniref:Asparagine synthetase domain-containing protein n=1 Tax=Dyella nitratireducens TaxID=1849580 RepID=A0ABQ1GFX0_9GAMM|nr:asparagine synthase-related protein [Dyella nitratireducens]GGA42743.1 hypothetical protein GCM10010981_34800 [Dyella nitratireducens]GLQ41963.1 hypothetical protein GCM10007902_18130 [Dyella nitratireducens]